MRERYASLEIIGYSYKLLLSCVPILPLKWRRHLYKAYINGLSEVAFDMYGVQVGGCVNLTKHSSKGFKNTDKELQAILEQIPRLGKVCGVLRERIASHRKKYKLKV